MFFGFFAVVAIIITTVTNIIVNIRVLQLL